MKHAWLARFTLSHLLMVLACLFLAGAQTGAHQVTARRPHTLVSLRQQIYGKRSQSKDIGVRTASASAPLFLEAPTYSTGLIPYSVAVADFNEEMVTVHLMLRPTTSRAEFPKALQLQTSTAMENRISRRRISSRPVCCSILLPIFLRSRFQDPRSLRTR